MTVVRKFTVNEERLTDLVHLMRRNFPPDLYLREFLKNNIQAIQRVLEKNEGHITIDANGFLEMQGLKKICFTDNGCGMNLEEMRKFLNKLASSHKKKLEQENFGIGAKIAAIADNKEGMYYESWKDGKGTAVLLGYDPNSNEYGLKKLSNGEDHIILDPGAKPKIIDKHGTRVTLFGNSHNQNTMLKPENITGTMEAWIYYNLNKRFFKLPENIKIQIRIGYHRPKEDTQHNYLANLKGQKESLDRNSNHSGTKDVSGAKIHWWIMNENKKSGHGREFLSGHSATLFENELTGYGTGKSNLSKFFGIVFGFSNVIIYIEPDKETHKYDMGKTCKLD